MSRYKLGPIGVSVWIIIIIAAFAGQRFVDAIKGLFVVGIGLGVIVFIGIALWRK